MDGRFWHSSWVPIAAKAGTNGALMLWEKTPVSHICDHGFTAIWGFLCGTSHTHHPSSTCSPKRQEFPSEGVLLRAGSFPVWAYTGHSTPPHTFPPHFCSSSAKEVGSPNREDQPQRPTFSCLQYKPDLFSHLPLLIATNGGGGIGMSNMKKGPPGGWSKDATSLLKLMGIEEHAQKPNGEIQS